MLLRGENICGKEKCGSIRFSFPNRDPILALLTNISSHIFLSREREKYFFFRALGAEFFPLLLHMVYSKELPLISPFPPSCKVKGGERKRKKKNLWHPFFFFFFFRTGKKRKKPSSSSSQKDKQMLERGRSEVQDSPIFFYARACFLFSNLVCSSIS